MAGQTLHSGFELPLKQCYYDGLVQQLVFAPGQVGCCLIIQMVIVLLFVPLPVRLEAWKNYTHLDQTKNRRIGTQEQMQHLTCLHQTSDNYSLIQNSHIMITILS